MGTDAQANWEEVSWKGPMKGAQSASSGRNQGEHKLGVLKGFNGTLGVDDDISDPAILSGSRVSRGAREGCRVLGPLWLICGLDLGCYEGI